MPAFDSQRNVFLLPLLRAAAEQNDDSLSVFAKVNPVAWTEINTVFKDPAADSLHIREVSQAQPVECGGHSPRRLGVETVTPLPEEVSSVTPRYSRMSIIWIMVAYIIPIGQLDARVRID